jgi:hypothetical protein
MTNYESNVIGNIMISTKKIALIKVTNKIQCFIREIIIDFIFNEYSIQHMK